MQTCQVTPFRSRKVALTCKACELKLAPPNLSEMAVNKLALAVSVLKYAPLVDYHQLTSHLSSLQPDLHLG